MIIQTLNNSGACSSLMMIGLGEISLHGDEIEDEEWNVETRGEINLSSFIKAFDKAVYRWDVDDGFDIKVHQHGFITAHTSHNQPNVEAVLTELGMIPSERTKNDKNPNQECILWVLPVRKFLENVDKHRG